MSEAFLQLLSAASGALIAALAVIYVGRQQHKQSEIATILQTLQNDNTDLRKENRDLREELDEYKKGKRG